MKNSIGVCLAIALSCSAFADDPLPRRGNLGLPLTGIEGGVGLGAEPQTGAAAGLGLQAGDRLVSIRGIDVTNGATLQAATAALPAGQTSPVTFEREGESFTVEIVAEVLPVSVIPGAEAEYGHVTLANGDRVRTIIMFPQAASPLARDAGLPLLYWGQGIGCGPIDNFDNPGSHRNIALTRLIEAGFAVAIAEKPGLGDSEGVACRDGGFDREIEAFSLALEQFVAHDRIDAARVYGLGFSMGGMQLPLLARETDFAGIITWGTTPSPWYDFFLNNFRMRAMLRGDDPAVAEERMRALRIVLGEMLVYDRTPDYVAEHYPVETDVFIREFDTLVHFAGRHFTFHDELDAAPLLEAWRAYDGRVLVLHGGYDWIASEYDHRLIADMINVRNPGHGEFEVIPGLDHGTTYHETLADSFANLFQGAPSTAFQERAVEWLVERAGAD